MLLLGLLGALGGATCNNAPAPVPLANTFGSPDDLATHVLAALTAGDRERLVAMSLSEAEFRDHIWPHLPAARPERNLPFDYVWGDLRQKSLDSLDQSMVRLRGARLALASVAFTGETSRYGRVTVRRDSVLTVTGPDGMTSELRVFGSAIEHDGRYKVFSFVVD